MESKDKKDKLEDIIRKHVIWSMAVGLLPVPVLDIALVTAVQVDMVKQISSLYDIEFSDNQAKILVSALGSSILSRIGASFMKSVPVVGSILGGATMSVLSGAATYAIAQVFIRHFESNGNFLNFDLTKAKKIFEQEFSKGKEYATKLEQEQKQNSKISESEEAFAKIEKLASLRSKGIISEEEFQTKKKELLEKL